MPMVQTIQGTSPLAPSVRPFSRIMSLDDEAIDQMIFKRIIRRSNLAEDIVSFATPAAALSYLSNPQSAPIDLILLDVNMPRMSGFEFLREAYHQVASPPPPPVIVMLTTRLGPLHQAQAKGLDEIKAYLKKPLDMHDQKQAMSLIQPSKVRRPLII